MHKIRQLKNAKIELVPLKTKMKDIILVNLTPYPYTQLMLFIHLYQKMPAQH